MNSVYETYTAAFKAQMVLELLKETQTISQLSSEHGVHVPVLRDWKQAALKGLPDVFANRDSWTDAKATSERLSTRTCTPRSAD
jgi:transposase-like protein